jgi:hypothetical protein
MNLFRNCLLLVLAFTVLSGCKGKKKSSLKGEDPVEITDFIEFFPVQSLPYNIGDTTLNKKEKDSLLINYAVFTQFVPDSFTNKVFGKGMKPKIYPMGKIKVSGAGNYLFVKAVSGEKRAGFVFVFDKKDKFIDGIQLLRVGQYPGAQQSVSVDKTYSINKIMTRRNADGSISDGKDVYGLSNGRFILIMTDPLDDNVTELINPIEDLSRKHKYAADYGTGKMNLVSIRDGRKSDRLSFFVHFDRSSGACTGDLKGEAIIKSAAIAEYREGGDPCVLRFSFTSSSVTVKELEGCGSHRGLRCTFDGTFIRKKEPKPAAKKQIKKNK